MHWFLTSNNSSRLLEEAAVVEDVFSSSTAFCAAGAIWVVIILLAIILLADSYRRERDLQASLHALRRSIFIAPEQHAFQWMNSNDDTATETSLKETEILSDSYNFQTLFLALFQASSSMLLLGGIHLDFHLTCVIFFSIVAFYLFVLGLMTMWMAHVADKETAQEYTWDNNDSMRLLELNREMKTGSSLSFLKHYVEVSFFHPLINTNQIIADDCYQDIGRDACRTFLMGVGQLILLGMYTWSIVDDGKPEFSNVRLFTYYCCGIFMQIAYLSGQDMFYKSLSSYLSFWGNVFCAAHRGYAYTWEPPKHLLYHRPRIVLAAGRIQGYDTMRAVVRLRNTPFLWFRFFLSTVVNIGGLIIVSFLLPLQLASNEDPLDFVLSAVGAYYILEIDDYTEPVTYTLVTQPQHEKITMMEMTSAFRQMDDEMERGAANPSTLSDEFRYT